MTAEILIGLIFLGALLAGLLGALTGLGGGVVIVPLLALVFRVNIHYAIGASLISVIATSSGAAAAYVRDGLSNIRIGMFLEVATTSGAICGAFVATIISARVIAIIFGLVLLYSAWLARQDKPPDSIDNSKDKLATALRMNGHYPSGGELHEYNVHHVPTGFGLMWGAGVLSGLLGIGSGAVKVLAMDQFMRIPFKVSTTTSNFMIGVTAAASAGIYLRRGYILPGLAMPVVLGVLLGALIGAKVLVRTEVKQLRTVFALVIVALGAEMIYSGATGSLSSHHHGARGSVKAAMAVTAQRPEEWQKV